MPWPPLALTPGSGGGSMVPLTPQQMYAQYVANQQQALGASSMPQLGAGPMPYTPAPQASLNAAAPTPQLGASPGLQQPTAGMPSIAAQEAASLGSQAVPVAESALAEAAPTSIWQALRAGAPGGVKGIGGGLALAVGGNLLGKLAKSIAGPAGGDIDKGLAAMGTGAGLGFTLAGPPGAALGALGGGV